MAAKNNAEDKQAEKKSASGVIGIALLAVVAAGGSFGMMFMLTPSQPAAAAACLPAAGPMGVAPLATADQVYVELNEILITIGDEPATRYVKMKTSIVADKTKADAVKKAEPMLADAFVSYLRSVELSDFEAAGFYPRMREQLARRAELVLGGDVSDGVLITEFLLR